MEPCPIRIAARFRIAPHGAQCETPTRLRRLRVFPCRIRNTLLINFRTFRKFGSFGSVIENREFSLPQRPPEERPLRAWRILCAGASRCLYQECASLAPLFGFRSDLLPRKGITMRTAGTFHRRASPLPITKRTCPFWGASSHAPHLVSAEHRMED